MIWEFLILILFYFKETSTLDIDQKFAHDKDLLQDTDKIKNNQAKRNPMTKSRNFLSNKGMYT